MDTVSKTKNPNREIRKISWEEFDRLIDRLEIKINKSGNKFDGIIGIPRGGLIVAVCLSHRLNLPLVNKISNKILIVDDLSDSGKTLWELASYLKPTATLHLRHTSTFIPRFFVEKIQDELIQYPWMD